MEARELSEVQQVDSMPEKRNGNVLVEDSGNVLVEDSGSSRAQPCHKAKAQLRSTCRG